MANDFTVNPMVVDTAMGAAAGLSNPIRVKRVYWFRPTDVAHTFNIGDTSTAANILLEGQCEVVNQSQVFDLSGQIWKDFRVDTLGSGTMYIFFR